MLNLLVIPHTLTDDPAERRLMDVTFAPCSENADSETPVIVEVEWRMRVTWLATQASFSVVCSCKATGKDSIRRVI